MKCPSGSAVSLQGQPWVEPRSFDLSPGAAPQGHKLTGQPICICLTDQGGREMSRRERRNPWHGGQHTAKRQRRLDVSTGHQDLTPKPKRTPRLDPPVSMDAKR